MKPIAAFIALNLATCTGAATASCYAWGRLPMPLPPLVALFAIPGALGLSFVSLLWLVKAGIKH